MKFLQKLFEPNRIIENDVLEEEMVVELNGNGDVVYVLHTFYGLFRQFYTVVENI